MEVRFTPEEEARLSRIATQEGLDPAELVKDAALRLLEDDTRFRAGVRKDIGPDLDFHPVEISGEPLSATILRERR